MNENVNSINVPDMEKDKAVFARANEQAYFILGLEILITIFLFGFYLDWRYLYEIRSTVFVIVGLAAFESASGYIQFIALNKVNVRDLKNDTVLGYYDKQTLLNVVGDALSSMRLGFHATSVFITREKSANASAIKTGLNPFIKSLNAIYINRTILHILKPDELKSIIGHELAHNFRYQQVIRKYNYIHFIFSTAVSFVALQYFKADSGDAILCVFILLAAVYIGLSMIGSKHGKRIEFLCDYEGAEIAGMVPAVNSLLKIGAQSEAELFLQMSAFLLGQGKGNITPSEILDIYEKNLPFGKIDTKLVEKKIKDKIAQKSYSKDGLSIRGFIDYLKEEQGDDTVHEEIQRISKQLAHLEKMPKISWAEDFLSEEKESLTLAEVESIIKELHVSKAVLLRLPEEITDFNSTHPSVRNRVLSLWYNTKPWL